MDGATIHKLFGTADNSGEPEPLVNKQGTILGVVISFTVFSWLCVAFRMHVRAKVVRSLGWDDLFVILSLLSITTGSVGICVATKYGMGKHIYYLSAVQVQSYLRTFYVSNASYQMSTAFIKISLLFQYLRIFEQPSFTRRLCIFTITFVCLWAITYSFLGWIPCVPVKAYWDWSIPASRWAYGSLNPEIFSATYETHSAVNIALDLLVLAIPVPLYFKPNAPLKSRLGLLALLAIGIAVNGVSIVRFITILQHRSATYPTLDFPWYGPVSIVLACVEVDLAMVASSVPIFWPVLRQKFPGIFVTKEVAVTREARRLESVELDDDIGTEEGRRSRVGSEASLRQENRGAGVRYMDEFVANQVDPLRRSKSVVTEVKAGEVDVDGGWWKNSR
ncbi:integral membrane protein [Colletotrichum incanum]|nr:integral membrane protein [Colletotrichum incanum]